MERGKEKKGFAAGAVDLSVTVQDPSCCFPLPLHPFRPYPGHNSRNPVDLSAVLLSFNLCFALHQPSQF